MKSLKLLTTTFLFLVTSFSPLAFSEENEGTMSIAGSWVFNENLSDKTDKRVEVALKAGGVKVKKKWFSRDKERYRGGPIEQELYDHLSYDHTLTIKLSSEELLFAYDDNYQRPVYLDNRRRSVSLNAIEDIEDFSFAHWENEKLLVEARPRDGGFADETYSLINNASQLKVELYIKPRSFEVPIELIRIYDRKVLEIL